MPPKTIDDQIAYPAYVKLCTLEDVHRVTGVSTFGRADVYLEGGPETSSADLSRAVIKQLASVIKQLPDDATVERFELLDEFAGPPKVKIRTVEYLQLSIDREMTSKHGIPIRAILDRIKSQPIDLDERPPKQKTLKALRELSIRAPSGKTLLLKELAEIKIVKTPSHRISHWPPRTLPKQ